MKDMKVIRFSQHNYFSDFLFFSTKLSPHKTPVTVVREAAETTALREMNSQKEQFRRLAIMADWDSKENTYRTLGMFSIFCAMAVLTAYSTRPSL